MKKIENHFDGAALAYIVVLIIAIVIYAQLGSPVSVGVTSLSNTTGYTGLNTTLTGGYGGWSTATTNIYTNTATITTLSYWLIPLLLIVVVLRRVT